MLFALRAKYVGKEDANRKAAPMLDATQTALPTRNEDWGFYGSASRWPNAAPGRAWEAAAAAVAARTGGPAEAVRDFLDSREGRWFADEASNFLAGGMTLAAAIEAAADRWMGWRIGKALSRETGIPAGLPLLTGWVAHWEIRGEAE